MQNKQFEHCMYDEWECKCHGQKKILTCYDNCPESENRTLQEMQVQVYCAALNGKELGSAAIDRMTRAARGVADDDAEEERPTSAPAQPGPAPPPPPAAKPSSDDADWDKAAKDKDGFSLVNDNAASSMGAWAQILATVAIVALAS
ncbi:hypothetical protein GGF46_001248 [Coemansia sp. RSA 552]|nr:hypothetical protein GGF46_001248 [Coemansia sp. RSA 552]